MKIPTAIMGIMIGESSLKTRSVVPKICWLKSGGRFIVLVAYVIAKKEKPDLCLAGVL